MEEMAEGKRIAIEGAKGRQHYFYISKDEIVVFLPDNFTLDPLHQNHYATTTALTRVMSMALRHGVGFDVLKKQLSRSSLTKGDSPDMILKAIEKWEQAETL